ncbi:unnamed protein product [Brassica rapa subsp. narinosa]|uniref:Uncharacterized protein n=1 Tax=Brassica campestris TaxID=3711 RepID=M4DNN1_BRACM
MRFTGVRQRFTGVPQRGSKLQRSALETVILSPECVSASPECVREEREQRKAFSSRGKRATESLPYRWTTQGIASGIAADSVLAASCTQE